MHHFLILALFLAASLLQAGGSVVPVGTYLYANEKELPDIPGALTIHFTTPGPRRLVVAFGRKYRKDRKNRQGTTEEQRGLFKPRLATLTDQGRTASFGKLPADYYDIIVFNPETMTIHEGLALWEATEGECAEGEAVAAYQAEIQKSLGLRDDRIGGWDGFFDTKRIERTQMSEGRAGVLMQQMRLKTALAESGEVLKGCIHSVDVVWVERALHAPSAGWQVIERQQLYRDELPSREFFTHKRLPALCGIRIGRRPRTLEDVQLE